MSYSDRDVDRAFYEMKDFVSDNFVGGESQQAWTVMELLEAAVKARLKGEELTPETVLSASHNGAENVEAVRKLLASLE
ncbi:hypothetical protein [Kitasatospora cineracea]|uniref:hypothetical protein n=1 Tax=Kitasatospora cineracea TaxID=88074 RepID=UPI003405DFFB